MIISVFTEKYKSLQKRLINTAIVESGHAMITVRAQWDTGATGTCISRELVKKLGLMPTGKVRVSTPSGIGIMNKYMVNLVLNREVRI